MGQFGEFDVRLDPWQVEYGAEIPAVTAYADDLDEQVELGVEAPAGEWAPVQPAARPLPDHVVFVDGVRRVEARLVVRQGEALFHGAFGSYAVGSVVVGDGHAEFGDLYVDRLVATGSGHRLDELVRVNQALQYRPTSIVSDDVNAPLQAIHNEMRLAEERLARELAGQPQTLVIRDGPLTFEETTRAATVGFIKRVIRLYLSGPHLELLARLQAGTRTPVFALRSTRRFARYSWFLRVADPGPGDSDYSGIVRMEVSEVAGREQAIRLADACATAIPDFAGIRGLHPRAPQNLLPIGALESRLRRELGDVKVIHRYIRAFIAEEALRV
jgi:hypothetical protein